MEYQKDRSGYRIPDTKEVRTDAINGSSIYLTLDSGIQRFAESAIEELEQTYSPKWGLVTVMDAKTGEILASATSPSYNPNDLSTIKSYENPLVTYQYEPGSTMKIYTYMCAIEKGTYNGNETYTSGSYTIGEDVIYDWNKKGWGNITYDLGFAYSSNVGAVNIVNNFINKGELRDCLEKFGFGSKTGIELSRELSGTINFNYPVEVAAASYGQGITTTPIQHLQALSIIANDGKMVTPHIVSKIVDPNTGETTYESKVEYSSQLVKESTVEKIRDLMHDVITNNDAGAATGTLYRIDGVDLIGKTGTAQIYSNSKGGYLTGEQDYVYSFAGMFPYDDPEIIIYAAVQQPTYGKGTGVSKVVKSVVQSIVKYYNMGNDNEENNEQQKLIEVNSYLNKNVDEIASKLETEGVEVVRIGDGTKVVSQYPTSGSNVVAGDKVFLITNGTNREIPNIRGWSRADILTLANLLNIEVNFEGYGYVSEYTFVDNKLNVILNDKYSIKKE